MKMNLLYEGTVRHRRFYHRLHQFSYKNFLFCVDISKIEESFQHQSSVNVEKWGWFSFRRKDYLDGLATPLDGDVRKLIQEKLHFYPLGKIYLLTQLACFGYCFNPISIYFVFKQDSDQLEAIVIEVTNTPWSERHIYVQALEAVPTHKSIYRLRFEKKLHVSPFLNMDYEYRLNLKIKENHIIFHIENFKNADKHFDATLSLKAVSHESNNIKKTLWRHPLMTYKTSAAIYWQALKLWVKGVSFHGNPKNLKE